MKTKIILAIIFISLFSLLGLLFHNEVNRQIQNLQKAQLTYLENSYTQGLDRFDMIANNVFAMLKKDEEFVRIFSKVSSANDAQRSKLREELHRHLEDEYERLYRLGVRQFHFILPDNKTFLRMHKPEKYDDDLTNIRYGFTYVNHIKQPVSGFEEGYTAHGFRHVFPLTHEGVYLGCIDISFSSTRLQDYIEKATKIHTHFIINKNIFELIAWKSMIQDKYNTSIESDDYMYAMSHHMVHEKLQKSEETLIKPNKEFINTALKEAEPFTFYAFRGDETYIVAFYPIINIKGDKVSAYIVSYTKEQEIQSFLFKEKIVLSILFILLLSIVIFKYHSIVNREKLEYDLHHDELTDVFNRKQFFNLAEETLNKSISLESEFSIVMVNVDWFQKVNETYGYKCGDKMLEEIATLLSENIAKNDIVARYGGEEFILLITTNEYSTHTLMQNIQIKMLEHQFNCTKYLDISLTLSFGIAQFHQSATLDATILRAYDALYKAKKNGRDCISFA